MRRILAAILLSGAAVLGVAAPASADVDDFGFDSFDAVYDLSRDDAGRSTLRVVETLVAVFPEFDQNRGIRRELVERYDGHPTGIEVASVTDENGTPRPYEEDSDDDFLVLTIAGDDYVHGSQTYVITYTQHDVTRYFADTDADEFYWDVNGTGWAQPFGRVTAEVRLDAELQDALDGNADAATGAEGADGPAEITPTDDGYAFAATDLAPFETLTFSIGFEPGTFTPRDSGFFAAPWPTISFLGALLAVAGALWAFGIRSSRLKDAQGRGIIVPEYVPPRDAGLLVSGLIAHRSTKSVPAQILALAVSGRIRVVEDSSGRKPTYELEFVGTQATGRDAFRSPEPTADELAFLHALFGESLTPGERRSLKKPDSAAAKRLTKLTSHVGSAAVARGYRRRRPGGLIAGALVTTVVGALIAFVFAAVSFETAYGGLWPLLAMILGVAALVASVIAVSHAPLDAPGVALRDYLKGLDLYIRMAEADRIRYLQSPQGAERMLVSTDDPRQVLRLNERLLPWAVLFGHEKRWADELGRFYEQVGEQPGWYVGSHPFNAAVFAGAVGGITTSVASSYSSASGGSAGGASAGGGGGGGGGGGV